MKQMKLEKKFSIHLKINIKIIWNRWKGSEFVFYYVHLLYYKCHKINPNWGGSNIDSLNWISNRATTINPIE